MFLLVTMYNCHTCHSQKNKNQFMAHFLLHRYTLVTIILALVITLFNYSNWFGPKPPVYSKYESETVVEEFRAVWIASVANINWPSERGLSVQKQKQEAIDMLDIVADANMNAVILQIRPQADALYQSQLEPWSYYLSGEQGVAPEPYYDPLVFWIEEAHKRGLELHAWINPYRAHHIEGGPITEHSIVNKLAEHVVKLDNGMYWMDPSQPVVVNHSLAVIADIVSRYDLDGLHYDDYFYPYPSYNAGAPFPDEDNYQQYLADGGDLSVSDWRRRAVDDFVKKIYDKVKAIKLHVKVGISPFGIWRPGNPEMILGFDQYEKLYADARLWLNEGWLDYFTPQLYWNVSKIPQSYPLLLSWWNKENHAGRHLWPGMSSNKASELPGQTEVINQIMITRAILDSQTGHVFWNIKTIADNPEFSQVLVRHVYNNQALVPASPWLDDTPPSAPEVTARLTENNLEIEWTNTSTEAVFNWVIYYKVAGKWQYKIFPSIINKHLVESGEQVTEIAVVAVDRTGVQSERINLLVKSFPEQG